MIRAGYRNCIWKCAVPALFLSRSLSNKIDQNYNIYDLYYTLNMARSVYYKDGLAPQYYADLAFDFLEDKDAPEGKAKRWPLAMHCAE